jgi:hypothetical protein
VKPDEIRTRRYSDRVHDGGAMPDPEPEEPQPYPTLATWLAGCPADNIWSEMLEGKHGGSDFLLDPMETILRALDERPPGRLASKRKAFRNDLDLTNQLNLRVELLIAYLLTQAGMPFEFGSEGQADIRCEPPDRLPVWLEVTTRTRDDTALLHDEMEDALAGLPVHVELVLEKRELVIPQPDRQTVCDRVKQAAQAISDGDHVTVALPEVAGVARCHGIVLFGPSRVVLDIGSELTNHAAKVEQELRNVLKLKTDQAARGGFDPMTLLVLDASRLGLSWLRPERIWAQMLPTMDLPWDTMPFIGLLITFTSLNTLGLNGAYILRQGLAADQQAALTDITAALGFSPSH